MMDSSLQPFGLFKKNSLNLCSKKNQLPVHKLNRSSRTLRNEKNPIKLHRVKDSCRTATSRCLNMR